MTERFDKASFIARVMHDPRAEWDPLRMCHRGGD
eukprot:gene4485-2205_t